MSLLFASLLALGSSAMTIAEDQPTTTPEKPKKERKICRNDEAISSHIPKRICKTADEWRETDAANASNDQIVVNRGR